MKSLISILCVLLFSNASMAKYVPQDTDEIVVMRDGKVIGKMSRSEYKVVKISDDVEGQTPVLNVTIYSEAKKYQDGHFSVILQGGVGQDGLTVDNNNGMYTVSERMKPVVGGTLCYTKDTVGICGTALSNKTGLLGIKKDFN